MKQLENKLSLLTYTHTKCADVHQAYFSRLNKYFSSLTHNYVTCNEFVPYGKCVVYSDEDPHYIQMVKVLEQIPTEYVIYAQEDYILYDSVNTKELDYIVNVMDADSTIPFVRMIVSGVGTYTIPYNDKLSYIDCSSEYYFSTQVSVWRKDVLIKMFNKSKVNSIFDEPQNSTALKEISPRGLYYMNTEKPVGGHFDSIVYPYTATALVKGKWNMKEYSNQLTEIFQEYDLNINQRGTYL